MRETRFGGPEKEEGRIEELHSELPLAGGRTRPWAMGTTLRLTSYRFEEEMMLLGLPVVSTLV